MDAIYRDEWKNYEDLKGDYPDAPPADAIVYASYTYEDYSGSAMVVWEIDGQWFENHDGHCSCNGLECWEPEATSVEALLMQKGWDGLPEAVTARHCDVVQRQDARL